MNYVYKTYYLVAVSHNNTFHCRASVYSFHEPPYALCVLKKTGLRKAFPNAEKEIRNFHFYK